ncbi:MAG: CRISPR-associated CARF protein Csa3 [Candidatus Caldarchaeum sp.]|nr:CRISPR-associated CARF protein Csa3 [Candidatus Caldarchaeum sp.]
MNNKTIFVTIGFTEWPVVSSLIKNGLAANDRVVTIVPMKSDPRSQTTLQEIRVFLSKFAPDVVLETLAVEVRSFEEAVSAILARMVKEKQERRKVVVNLSGGMRVLILETYVAMVLSGSTDAVAEIMTEDKHELVLPNLLTVDFHAFLKEIDFKILHVLRNGQSILDVAKAVRKPVSTTYRRVVGLEKIGVLRTFKHNRVRHVELTALGKIIRDHFSVKVKTG